MIFPLYPSHFLNVTAFELEWLMVSLFIFPFIMVTLPFSSSMFCLFASANFNFEHQTRERNFHRSKYITFQNLSSIIFHSQMYVIHLKWWCNSKNWNWTLEEPRIWNKSTFWLWSSYFFWLFFSIVKLKLRFSLKTTLRWDGLLKGWGLWRLYSKIVKRKVGE